LPTSNSGSASAASAGAWLKFETATPEQPDAHGRRQQRAHEFEARLAQEIMARDHG
jgi:hypothetical protein